MTKKIINPGCKGCYQTICLGPVGAQGFQGFQGFQGAIGAQGIPGPCIYGPTGPQGPPGPMGVGPQGFQGASGLQGAQGPRGFQGAIGAIGATGTGGIASGMIYKNNWNVVGKFVSGCGCFMLVESSVICGGISAWETSDILYNVSTILDGNGLPTKFKVSITGVYLITYDISFSTNIGGSALQYEFVVQRNNDGIILSGSDSKITVTPNNTIYHVSQTFIVIGNINDIFGVYSRTLNANTTICNDMYDGTFTIHLLYPSEIA